MRIVGEIPFFCSSRFRYFSSGRLYCGPGRPSTMTITCGGGMAPGKVGLRVARMEIVEQASDKVAAKNRPETLSPERAPEFMNLIDVVIERQANK
jgi:hypothetical protein